MEAQPLADIEHVQSTTILGQDWLSSRNVQKEPRVKPSIMKWLTNMAPDNTVLDDEMEKKVRAEVQPGPRRMLEQAELQAEYTKILSRRSDQPYIFVQPVEPEASIKNSSFHLPPLLPPLGFVAKSEVPKINPARKISTTPQQATALSIPAGNASNLAPAAEISTTSHEIVANSNPTGKKRSGDEASQHLPHLKCKTKPLARPELSASKKQDAEEDEDLLLLEDLKLKTQPTTSRPEGKKRRAQTCGKCGQLGHIRNNKKKCSFYVSPAEKVPPVAEE